MFPELFIRAMSETGKVEAGALTPEEAAETIEQAQGYEEPLRRRTEGVTWMVWGLVPAGIQLSYDASLDYIHGFPWWLNPLILLGWALIGILFTYAVWRIAVLDRPGVREHRWRSILGGALWLPIVYAGMGLAFVVTDVGWQGAFLPLVGIGLTWLVLGLTNVFKATSIGRRTIVAVGAAILLVATTIAILVDLSSAMGRNLTQLAAIFAGGGIPFVAGLWQSLHG